MYYFAYGSNMDERQMKDRCPDSIVVGREVLKDYKLSFTIFSPKRKCGCADIVQDQGDEVWGVLYAVTEEDLKKLDECEGHPVHYKRCTVSVVSDVGMIQAAAYEVAKKSANEFLTSKNYKEKIALAAEKFNFPQKYVAQVLQMQTID